MFLSFVFSLLPMVASSSLFIRTNSHSLIRSASCTFINDVMTVLNFSHKVCSVHYMYGFVIRKVSRHLKDTILEVFFPAETHWAVLQETDNVQ